MNGVPGGVYFDVLCVCVAGQFVTIFSDFYGMLVFMLVSEGLFASRVRGDQAAHGTRQARS